MAADPLRLLAARSELGYVDRVDRALIDEPEAVSAETQRMLTESAHRSRAAQDRSTWLSAQAQIRDAVAMLSAPAFDGVRGELRIIIRHVERIDKILAA